MRVMMAMEYSDSANVGRMRCTSTSARPAQLPCMMVSRMKNPVPPDGCRRGDTRPLDGSQCRMPENSRISRMPDQKMGIDTPTSAMSMLTLSAALFFFTAASTPKATPTIDATMMAQIASSAVAGKRAAISAVTGWWV